jgi:hypothetical protein
MAEELSMNAGVRGLTGRVSPDIRVNDIEDFLQRVVCTFMTDLDDRALDEHIREFQAAVERIGSAPLRQLLYERDIRRLRK